MQFYAITYLTSNKSGHDFCQKQSGFLSFGPPCMFLLYSVAVLCTALSPQLKRTVNDDFVFDSKHSCVRDQFYACCPLNVLTYSLADSESCYSDRFNLAGTSANAFHYYYFRPWARMHRYGNVGVDDTFRKLGHCCSRPGQNASCSYTDGIVLNVSTIQQALSFGGAVRYFAQSGIDLCQASYHSQLRYKNKVSCKCPQNADEQPHCTEITPELTFWACQCISQCFNRRFNFGFRFSPQSIISEFWSSSSQSFWLKFASFRQL